MYVLYREDTLEIKRELRHYGKQILDDFRLRFLRLHSLWKNETLLSSRPRFGGYLLAIDRKVANGGNVGFNYH